LICSQSSKHTLENRTQKNHKGKHTEDFIEENIILTAEVTNTEELQNNILRSMEPDRIDHFHNKHQVYPVFVHSSSEFFTEIIKLVDREFEQGNRNAWEKDMILWQVKR
jgi:hypothetical protein